MENIAKSSLFMSGRSEAVRIPAAMRFPEGTKEVILQREGQSLIISPAGSSWDSFFALEKLGEDFMPERDQGCFQEREEI